MDKSFKQSFIDDFCIPNNIDFYSDLGQFLFALATVQLSVDVFFCVADMIHDFIRSDKND